jgi:tellurium resistance protein TerD
MSTSLVKGGNISLTKAGGASMQRVVVACGWDVNQKSGLFNRGSDYDLDLTAAGLDTSGMVPNLMDPTDRDYQEWFIHANHRYPSSESVRFMGDNRTGAGEGDDEQIKVDLKRVPANIERIVFAVVIWRAEERGQKFGNVQNAFIRVFNEDTGEELTRYDLGAEFSDETLVVFGELYRRGVEWYFRAIGHGYKAAVYRQQHNIERAFETEYARFAN